MSNPHGLLGMHCSGRLHSDIVEKIIGEFAGSASHLYALTKLTDNIPLHILHKVPPSQYVNCTILAEKHVEEHGPDAEMAYKVEKVDITCLNYGHNMPFGHLVFKKMESGIQRFRWVQRQQALPRKLSATSGRSRC